MASPGLTRGVCGHAMAGFDQHAHCARCRDKKKGTDPCIKGNVCPSSNILTEEQKLCLATPVYQNKKEKQESKATEELVAFEKQASHKFFGSKGGLFSPKEVPRPLSKQYRSGSYRQHHSGGLCKQGMRSGPLCALLWRNITWSGVPTIRSPSELATSHVV